MTERIGARAWLRRILKAMTSCGSDPLFNQGLQNGTFYAVRDWDSEARGENGFK